MECGGAYQTLPMEVEKMKWIYLSPLIQDTEFETWVTKERRGENTTLLKMKWISQKATNDIDIAINRLENLEIYWFYSVFWKLENPIMRNKKLFKACSL